MKKAKKNNYREYEIKFWKDWIESDGLKRLELVNGLPLFNMCLNMKNNKFYRSTFSTLINGYFEDLESATYTKIILENKKAKLNH